LPKTLATSSQRQQRSAETEDPRCLIERIGFALVPMPKGIRYHESPACYRAKRRSVSAAIRHSKRRRCHALLPAPAEAIPATAAMACRPVALDHARYVYEALLAFVPSNAQRRGLLAWCRRYDSRQIILGLINLARSARPIWGPGSRCWRVHAIASRSRLLF